MALPIHIYSRGWQIAKNPDILLSVTDYLPLQDILSLLQASKQIQSFARYVYVRQYHRLLSTYVDIPYQFRELIGRHRSIISGSAVVWLIEGFPSSWTPGDLDIYTPKGESKPVINYLVAQGYRKVPLVDIPEEDDDPFQQFNWHTFHLTHLYHPKLETRIEIFESETGDPTRSILYSRGTHTMNFLSWNTLVSLYPKMTLNKKGVVTYTPLDPYNDWIWRWRRRRYRLKNGYVVTQPNILLHLHPLRRRWIGDSHSLVLQFDTPIVNHLVLLNGEDSTTVNAATPLEKKGKQIIVKGPCLCHGYNATPSGVVVPYIPVGTKWLIGCDDCTFLS
jgi:hypothetical protein